MYLPTQTRKLFLPLLILFSLGVAALVYWWGYEKPIYGIDDANIYFVYMKNLAEGRGFVWNAGGERVEGFTSLLWTLAGAVFYKLSPVHFPFMLFAFGFILSFFTIYHVLNFSRKLHQKEGLIVTASDVIILTLILAPRGFIEWNVINLMETSLWTFLLVRTTLELCRYYVDHKINVARFSILLVLINLTRPEGTAFNLLFIFLFFMIYYAETNWKHALRKAVIPLLVHVISLGSLILWRLSYFGYPFPNTYYAKVSANKKDNIVAGLHYIFNFYFLYPHIAFLTGVLVFFGIYFWRKKQSQTELTGNDKILAVLFTVVLAGLGLPVLTGGDHFAFARFYLPFLPLLYLAATDQYLWRHCLGLSIRAKKMASAMLLMSFIVAVLFSSKSTVFDFFTHHGLVNFPEFDIALKGRVAAKKLNEAFAGARSYPSIGSFATGGVGYGYRGKTIDLLGLNSTIMAHASRIKTGIRNHASFDKKAFWILQPDVLGTAYGGEVITDTASFVLYENIPGYRNDNFLYLAYKKIFDDDDFRSAYLPAFVYNKNQDYFIFGYYHKSFLKSLDSSVYGIKLLNRTYNPHGPLSKK